MNSYLLINDCTATNVGRWVGVAKACRFKTVYLDRFYAPTPALDGTDPTLRAVHAAFLAAGITVGWRTRSYLVAPGDPLVPAEWLLQEPFYGLLVPQCVDVQDSNDRIVNPIWELARMLAVALSRYGVSECFLDAIEGRHWGMNSFAISSGFKSLLLQGVGGNLKYECSTYWPYIGHEPSAYRLVDPLPGTRDIVESVKRQADDVQKNCKPTQTKRLGYLYCYHEKPQFAATPERLLACLSVCRQIGATYALAGLPLTRLHEPATRELLEIVAEHNRAA